MNMWYPLLLVFLDIFLVQARDYLPHTKCERTWEKVGCFRENIRRNRRTVPVLLISDRDPRSRAFDGHRIDWHAWEESTLSLACRCANATREKGWKVFGLQFYGECWSGENAEATFNRYGRARSSRCLQELVGPCNISKEMECVGAYRTNYIYRLKDFCAVSNPCKNGGTCSNIPGGYKCTCDVKYTGRNCETDVDECKVGNPCQNGAKCINSIGGFSCQCPPDFKGKLCDEAPAECSSYSRLSEADRASGRPRGNVLRCDRYDLSDGWYRFTDAAGTIMPTSPVAKHHCGTHAPGWMNGQHPTIDDGAVKRKVCFHWSDSVCLWSTKIRVRNCGGFYVYWLPKTPYCWLRYCGHTSDTPAECSIYSKLSEADRASSRHRGNVLKCDRDDLADGWYRFTDAAGNIMPTSPVEKHHCGTHAPGWMNGLHPAKDDGAVERQVCFHWSDSVCLWSTEIRVRNCGGFYVYWLPKTPYCWLRYCGHKSDTPSECSSYSKLSEADRASSRHRGNVLKCDQTDLADGWYRFTGAAGIRMPTSPVEKHHCGTHAPGWMNGQHPTKDDGAVERQVCFHWSDNVCLWSTEIGVRNCGGFYVYWLPKTPYCYLRYCGHSS